MIKFDFSNKIVLILGGSKGIGKELAIQYLNFGAKVCVISSSNFNLLCLKQELIVFKNNLFTVKLDLKKKNSLININKVFFKIKNHFKGHVDILINNAGGPPFMKINDLDEKIIYESLNMNLVNQMFFSINAIKIMNKKKWGRIINLTSSTAKEPAKNMVLSNLTRSAFISFSKTLSLEATNKGVTINNILTGGVATKRLLELALKRVGKKKLNQEITRIASSKPVGYLASTENFVQTILFLTTEQASYVSGTSIAVDGGASKSLF